MISRRFEAGCIRKYVAVNWFSTLLTIHTKASLPLFNKICSMVFKHMKFWMNTSIMPLCAIILHEVLSCILWIEVNVNVEKDVKSIKVKYYLLRWLISYNSFLLLFRATDDGWDDKCTDGKTEPLEPETKINTYET